MELIEEKQKILVKYLKEKDTYTAKVVHNYSKLSKRRSEHGLKAILEKQRGKIIGCLVAVNNNVVGWSLINKLDRQWNHSWSWLELNPKEQKEILDKNKRIAYQIAYNRAMIADNFSQEELEAYYFKIPNSIEQDIIRMGERAELYFK